MNKVDFIGFFNTVVMIPKWGFPWQLDVKMAATSGPNNVKDQENFKWIKSGDTDLQNLHVTS